MLSVKEEATHASALRSICDRLTEELNKHEALTDFICQKLQSIQRRPLPDSELKSKEESRESAIEEMNYLLSRFSRLNQQLKNAYDHISEIV